jgi:hypothetical protein
MWGGIQIAALSAMIPAAIAVNSRIVNAALENRLIAIGWATEISPFTGRETLKGVPLVADRSIRAVNVPMAAYEFERGAEPIS